MAQALVIKIYFYLQKQKAKGQYCAECHDQIFLNAFALQMEANCPLKFTESILSL